MKLFTLSTRSNSRTGTRYLPAIAALLVVAIGSAVTVSAAGSQELAEVRAATARYQNVATAEAVGYVPFLGCLEQPGVGGMGYHYVNFNIVDLTVDASAPESMVYAPGPQGQLQLGAVEYIVPADD